MTTDTATDNTRPQNPFKSQGTYSPEAVELMRVLGRQRRETGQTASSPAQILAAVRDLGYQRSDGRQSEEAREAEEFVSAMTAYQQRNEVAHPTCEDLLNVLQELKYVRAVEETSSVDSGLPIDRRRREEDERQEKQERRSSLEPSPQEQMELTPEENVLLDALKDLRHVTGREFASSEELLSILWGLNYRPTNEDGFPIAWLDDDERCRFQAAFTQAVEARMVEGEFLTCRTLLEIVAELGFRKT